MRFVVKWVNERYGTVLARCLENPHDLSWGAGATLGGWPVRTVSVPRALAGDGSPRKDLFAFAMAKSHAARLRRGEVVELLAGSREG